MFAHFIKFYILIGLPNCPPPYYLFVKGERGNLRCIFLPFCFSSVLQSSKKCFHSELGTKNTNPHPRSQSGCWHSTAASSPSTALLWLLNMRGWLWGTQRIMEGHGDPTMKPEVGAGFSLLASLWWAMDLMGVRAVERGWWAGPWGQGWQWASGPHGKGGWEGRK